MFGKRIAYLRKKKGLSQYKAADILGFSRGKLGNYEQGSRQPDYETIKKIADFYNVSIDYLLCRTDNPTSPNSDDSNLFFFDMEGLDKEEIDDIKQHIEYIKWKSKQDKRDKNE